LPDAQFLYICGSLAIVHNHFLNPDILHPRGLPCIYVGTGCLENFHGGKFLDPATGRYLFSTNMTVDEKFLPFRELESNPAADVTVLVFLLSDVVSVISLPGHL
jgi:hypothetical protein